MSFEWYPHPGPQQEFCERGEFEVLFGGAAGPGKTDCLIMEATRFVEIPEYRGILFRRTYPMLEEIIDRCWKWYPKIGGEYRAGNHRWTFPSGAKIKLSHMQHENNMYDHQGKEYHFAGFDELTQFLKTQYLYIHSRVRTTNPHIPKRIRSTTNPGGISHMFVKERFVDVCAPCKTYIDPDTGFSRAFIPATVYDNPTLIENDPLYVKQLEALPEIEKLRLLHGVWDMFEGQVFVELSQRVHGCEPFQVPPEQEIFCSFDWGFAKPYSVGYYTLDFDGVLYRVGFIYGCKEGDEDVGLRETAIEVARKMLDYERERHFPKIKFRVADPACWNKPPRKNKGEVKGPSVIEDMGKEGLFFLKADNNRILGKQQVHARFKLEEEIDYETGEVIAEIPRFRCFNNDEHFWRTMMNLRQDERNPEDVDTDQEDHIYDELRYAMMARPVRPKKIQRIPAGSFTAERNRLINAKAYARRHGVSLQVAYSRVR